MSVLLRGRNSAAWAVLAALVLIGAYLRLANLGALGFRWDEDLSALAVRAILERGIPELPSGMVYLRGGVFSYLMSASAELFGFSEFSLRLPAALFGIGLIPLAFLFGKALFDTRTGLLVAALITISIWDVEFSRYARMYTAFSFFYLLTLLCLWRYRVRSESTAGGMLCVLLAMLTISLHQLGYTLVPAFFFALILRGPSEWLRPRRLAFPLAAAALAAAFFFSWGGVLSYFRELPSSAQAAAPTGLDGAGPASLIERLASQLPLLGALWQRAPLVLLVLAVGVLLAAAAFAVRRVDRPVDRIVLLAVAACCATQLFNFALLGIAGLAFLKRAGLPSFRRHDVVFAAALTGVSFIAWLLLAVTLGLGESGAVGGGAAVKAAIRALLDYPHFFIFWGYVNEWPLVSIAALIGGARAFDLASRRPSDPACGFALLVLATPLIVNGLFDSAFELFRYNVPLNPYYFTFVALGLLHWRDVIAAWRPASAPPKIAIAAGTALLAVLVLGYNLNPLRPWLVTRQDYLNDGLLYRAFDMTRYTDFKTPAEFVATHAAPRDTILVLDSREYFNYIGRLDYWIRTGVYETQTYRHGGELRDLYVATPLIMSLGQLERTLQSTEGAAWLIASDSTVANTRAVDDEIKKFILEQGRRVVYVGRDGDTKVYRFE